MKSSLLLSSSPLMNLFSILLLLPTLFILISPILHENNNKNFCLAVRCNASSNLSDPNCTNTTTITKTITTTQTITATMTSTKSQSISSSVSISKTISGTGTKTITGSASITPSLTTGSASLGTLTLSNSQTITGTDTKTITTTKTKTSSLSKSKTITVSGTATISATKTITISETPQSFTDTETMTATETISSTLPGTQTLTKSRTLTKSISRTLSTTPSITISKSLTLTNTITKTSTTTPSLTKSKSISKTLSLTFTATETGTATITLSKSITPTISITPISLTTTETHSATLTSTATQTSTKTLTSTLTKTHTMSLTHTLSSTPSLTKTSTITFTSSPTLSLTGTSTKSQSLSKSITQSHSLTQSLTASLSSTHTMSPTTSGTSTKSKSISATFSVSPSFSLSDTHTATISLTGTKTLTLTKSLSLSISKTKTGGTSTMTESLPLTTSAMPPTTTPMPTPTLTFMTRCPSNCRQGKCNDVYPYQCICYKTVTRGFWAGSEFFGPCDKCATGYYGARCDQACEGGACSACGGHGVCFDGLTGDGSCLCYNSSILGFWDLSSSQTCSRCQSGYWGVQCTNKCLCTSHGNCFDGRTGNGTCACVTEGYFGDYCEQCDPTIITDGSCSNVLSCHLDCSGNGVCRQTSSTSTLLVGECDCFPNFAGTGCEITCQGMLYDTPSAGLNTSCFGRSTCNDGRNGDGTCNQPCSPSSFEGSDCGSCKLGYWGNTTALGSCTNVCPGFIESGMVAPCNNSGTCNQVTGVCECSGFYGGAVCNISCPVGASNGLPCSGNGVCSSATAECVCYQDSVNGFWNGTTCDRCNDDYRTSQCNVQCPILNGEICNGNGTCGSDGKCLCNYPACGRVCDTEWNGTRCNSCPVDGFFGPHCNYTCLCEHGNCSMGKNGDGSCECELGYAGPYCNVTCPLGPGPSTCSGNGVCLQADASCDCNRGFAGPNCSLQCPDVNCSGHGQCLDGPTGSGTCKCDDGYAGPACETKCNSCGIHGTCPGSGNSTCVCEGNFTGDHCDECLPGLSGDSCNLICYNGVTNGTNCSCFGDWVSAQCDAQCPKDLSSNLTCGGPSRGICNFETATCTCADSSYKGPACSCTILDCQTRYSTTFATCDDVTGTCKCSGNLQGLETTGCSSCAVGFWGSDCKTPCDCNDHGSCSKSTGACSCFTNDVDGYWSGVTCSTCLSGYMGEKCQQKAVAITLVTPISYSQTVQLANQYTMLDENRSLYYVGADFLNLIFNVTPTIPTVIDTIIDESSSSSSSSSGIVKTLSVPQYVKASCANATLGGDGGNIAGLFSFPASQMTTLTTFPSNQLVYLLHQNLTTVCQDIPVRVYMGPNAPLNTFITNKTRVIDNLLPFGLVLFSFLFQELPATCVISSSFQIACEHVVIPPLTSPVVTSSIIDSVNFNTLRHAARTPTSNPSSSSSSYNQRIVMSGVDSSNKCAIIFKNISKVSGTLSFHSQMQLHDVANEMLTQHTWRCKSVDSFYETPTTGVLVYAALADKGCYIGAFTTKNAQSSADVVVYTGAKVSSNLYQGRGIIYDEESQIGIAVFNQLAIKFRFGLNSTSGIPSIEAYGQQVLTASNIYRMDLFMSQQIVYAPRRQASGIEVLRFLMIEVLSIYPDVADRRGGAVIVLTGRGFRNVSTATCSFGGDLTPATYISPSQVSCVAPFSTSTDTCLVQEVEVSMNGAMFTQNQVTINRPKDVTITSLTPPVVRHNSTNFMVVLIGRGFVDNTAAKCKLVINPNNDSSSANPSNFHIYNAIYVSPVQYNCIIPMAKTITYPGSFMTLALDGQIFSSTNAPHSVVGPAENILCTPDTLSGGTTTTTSTSTNSSSSSSSPTTITNSSNEVEFPPWPTIYVRDVNNNLLGNFDDVTTRSATINASDGFKIRIPTSVSYPFAVRNGTANLAGYRVPDPVVGIRPTYVTVDGKWTCSFWTEITAGDLAQLQIKSQPVTPSDILLPTGLLPQTTEIWLMDKAGNVVPGNVYGGSTNIILNATFVKYDPLTGVANTSYLPQGQIQVRDNGLASLSPFQVKLTFGVQYSIHFVVADNENIFTFTEKFSPSCPTSQFQVLGETACRDCPDEEAICNGSTILLNKAGYWRMNNESLNFLACPIPEACPEGTADSYGASRCAPGYHGVLCNDCEDDIGKDSVSGTCKSCPSVATQVIILLVLLLVAFFLLFFIIVLALQNNTVPTSSLGRAAVLGTLLISTLQTVSLMSFLGIDWPSGMKVVLNISAFLFEFRMTSLHAIDCLFRRVSGMNTGRNWIFFLFIVTVLLLGFMILAVKVALKINPNLLLSNESRKEREKFNQVAKNSYTGFWTEGWVKEHQTSIVVISCCQVFLYFLMQIDLYYLLATLQCRDILYTETSSSSSNSTSAYSWYYFPENARSDKTLQVMTIDTRVDCDSSEYKSMHAVSIFFAAVLGFLCTIGVYLAVGYYRFRRHEDDFQAACSFLFLGLNLRTWFWNCLLLLKKFLLVLIVSFLKYPVGLYCYMWIVMICSWLEYDLKPYIDSDFNQLSMVFNFVVIIVSNIGMTMEVVSEELADGTPIHLILDICSVTVIIIAILFFSWKCSKMFITRYIKERRQEKMEFVEDVDEKTIEVELQKRHDDEQKAQKSREEEEMDSIERIRKELRVKAMAEKKRRQQQEQEEEEDQEGNENEFSNVASDYRKNRRELKKKNANREERGDGGVDDQFATILDDFYGANAQEEKEKWERQSRGAEDVASWSISNRRSALDDENDVDDDRKSTISASSSASSAYLAMKRRNDDRRSRKDDDEGPQTTYVPGKRNNNNNSQIEEKEDLSRTEVDDAIDSFLTGGGASPMSTTSANNNNMKSAFDNQNEDDDDDLLFATIKSNRPDFEKMETMMMMNPSSSAGGGHQVPLPVPLLQLNQQQQQKEKPPLVPRVDTSTTTTTSQNPFIIASENNNNSTSTPHSPTPLSIPLPSLENNNNNNYVPPSPLKTTFPQKNTSKPTTPQPEIPSFLLKKKSSSSPTTVPPPSSSPLSSSLSRNPFAQQQHHQQRNSPAVAATRKNDYDDFL